MRFSFVFFAFFFLPAVSFGQEIAGERTVRKPSLDPSRLIWGTGEDCVRIVEYLDYECPFCKAIHTDIEKLLDLRGQDICFYVKHLPVKGSHRYAFFLAAHYESIRLQSIEAAVQFHNLALEELNSPSGSDQKTRAATDREFLSEFYSKVGSLNVDLDRVQIDWSSDDIRERIEQDVKEAAELGADETPFFWIEGRIIRGQHEYDVLESVVDDVIREATYSE